MANHDTALITSFLNEQTYNVEISVSKHQSEIFKWCNEHTGIRGIDWELIQLNEDVLLGIFTDKNFSVLFELTWGCTY